MEKLLDAKPATTPTRADGQLDGMSRSQSRQRWNASPAVSLPIVQCALDLRGGE
jgi:hypothetical protein